MTNPTSNYGWVLPNSADLVTDLPADFDVALQGVDTTLKALNPATTLGDIQYRSATANTNTRLPIGTNGQVLGVVGGVPAWTTDASGMTNPMTTTGDTIYSSSGSTPARLGIGTTGQVLTVAGGVPTWATTAATSTSWSLLNTGGTALTGATVVTVSGISGKDKIMVLVQNASSATAAAFISIRLNTDTGTNYASYGIQEDRGSVYDPAEMAGYYDLGANIPLGRMSGTAASPVVGAITISGCNASGVKAFQSCGAGRGQGSNGHGAYTLQGFYNSSSTISSISVFSSTGNLDAGTVFVYTSAA